MKMRIMRSLRCGSSPGTGHMSATVSRMSLAVTSARTWPLAVDHDHRRVGPPVVPRSRRRRDQHEQSRCGRRDGLYPDLPPAQDDARASGWGDPVPIDEREPQPSGPHRGPTVDFEHRRHDRRSSGHVRARWTNLRTCRPRLVDTDPCAKLAVPLDQAGGLGPTHRHPLCGSLSPMFPRYVERALGPRRLPTRSSLSGRRDARLHAAILSRSRRIMMLTRALLGPHSCIREETGRCVVSASSCSRPTRWLWPSA